MRIRPIIAIAAIVLFLFAMKYGQYLVEDTELFLHPNAQRAFEYGEIHFDAVRHPDSYDLHRASVLFQQAQQLQGLSTTSIPYLYHELARVAFLQARYQAAMGYINTQIHLQGDNTPNSYYVRGLIEGYMRDYPDAIRDYSYFVSKDPHNWAALNDYAWVLMMNDQPKEAAIICAQALQQFPDNPWLLNMSASALYRLGDLDNARVMAQYAQRSVARVTTRDWLTAYPGNDPATAKDGIHTLNTSIIHNLNLLNSVKSSQ